MLARQDLEQQIKQINAEGNKLALIILSHQALIKKYGIACFAKESLQGTITSKIKSFYIVYLQCSFEDINNNEIFTLKELESCTLTNTDSHKLHLTLEVLLNQITSDFTNKIKNLTQPVSSSKAAHTNNDLDVLKEQVRLLRAEVDELKKERLNSLPTKSAGLGMFHPKN